MARVVALDGISESGKTTTARILQLYLLRRGCKILVVNEKEYEPFRSWAISWHKRPVKERVFEWQDIVNVAKARAVVHASLAVAMAQSDFVFFDRSLYTSAVYQASTSISPSEIVKVNLYLGAIEPEMVVLFLGDANLCYRRLLERTRKKTGYNLPATTETQEQLQEYLKRYMALGVVLRNVVLIDASFPTATKVRTILQTMQNYGF